MSPFVQPLFHYLRLIIHYELGPVLLCFMVVYTTDSVVVWPLTFLLSHQISQLTYLQFFLSVVWGHAGCPCPLTQKIRYELGLIALLHIMMSIFPYSSMAVEYHKI